MIKKIFNTISDVLNDSEFNLITINGSNPIKNIKKDDKRILLNKIESSKHYKYHNDDYYFNYFFDKIIKEYKQKNINLIEEYIRLLSLIKTIDNKEYNVFQFKNNLKTREYYLSCKKSKSRTDIRLSTLNINKKDFYKKDFEDAYYSISNICNFLSEIKSNNYLIQFLKRLDESIYNKNIILSDIISAFIHEFLFLKILEEDFLKTGNLYIIDYTYNVETYCIEMNYNTLIYETKEKLEKKFIENYTKTYHKIIVDDGMNKREHEVSLNRLYLNFYESDYVGKHFVLCNELISGISFYLLKQKLYNQYRLDELINDYFKEKDYLSKSLIFLSQIKANNYFAIYDKNSIDYYDVCITKIFNKKINITKSTNKIGYIKNKYKELKFLEINKRYDDLLLYINSNIITIDKLNKEFGLLLKSLIIDYLTEVNDLYLIDSEDKMIPVYIDNLFEKIDDLKEFFVFINDFKYDNIQELNLLLKDRIEDESKLAENIENKKSKHKDFLNNITK